MSRGALALVLGMCAVIVGCAPTPTPPTSPSFVFVVIDTLRADHLGSHGYARAETPRLDELARNGTRFAAARAPTSWTLPSVVSMLTGRYPGEHGVERLENVLDEKSVTIAEALQARGYETAAFSANVAVVIASAGIAQGFDSFEVLETTLGEGEVTGDPVVVRDGSGRQAQAATADRVTDAALAWLRARKDPTRPYFLYVHYFDPHTSYFPPPEFAARFGVQADDPLLGLAQNMAFVGREPPSGRTLETLIALYDAEIAFTDVEVGRFLDGVRAADPSDPLVVVTADHGEAFAEHGRMQHGDTLFEEVLHVPLIVAGAGVASGRVVDTPVSIVSLPLTLAELARAELPGPFSVPSLAGLLRGGDRSTELIHAELAWGRGVHHWAAIDGTWKLIVDRELKPLLFDLASDPGERTNRQSTETARTKTLRDAVQTQVKAGAKMRAANPPGQRELDNEQRKRLRALGYVQ